MGAVYLTPEAKPGGSSSGDSVRPSGNSEIHCEWAPATGDTSIPLTCLIAAFGSAAWADRTLSPTRAHRCTRGEVLVRVGPQIAPATNDVVRSGGSAARTRVASPASASVIAVASPTTPAPTTMASV